MFNFTKCDAAENMQYMLQDPATPAAEGIMHLHNDIMTLICFILIFVCWILFRCIFIFQNKDLTANIIHGTLLEILWTIVPALILMVIAVPSFALLYSMDEVIDPSMTIKCVGHQWYWSYEYSDYFMRQDTEDYEPLNFDSYMLPEDSLDIGNLRLLEVDRRIVLPINTHIRVIITAADVLHCWTIPSFGVKLDACPGRLNQTSLYIKREGVYYGQCSEICGINHGFMPIVVEAVSITDFATWMEAQNDD